MDVVPKLLPNDMPRQLMVLRIQTTSAGPAAEPRHRLFQPTWTEACQATADAIALTRTSLHPRFRASLVGLHRKDQFLPWSVLKTEARTALLRIQSLQRRRTGWTWQRCSVQTRGRVWRHRLVLPVKWRNWWLFVMISSTAY